MLRLLAATLTLVLLALLPAAPATAQDQTGDSGIGIRLLDIPAATQDDPRARTYIVDHVNPGNSLQRRIEVQNDTDTARSVQVYAGSARIEDGAFIGNDGAAESELTTWITTQHDTLELPAGGSAEVLITIDVPSDASEGEQYAAIWAETRSAADATTGVQTASRVGIRVYLSVGPGNGPAVDFTVDELLATVDADGRPTLTATVTNTGGRALDLTGSLSLAEGPGQLSAGPFPTEGVTTVAPGEAGEVVVTMDEDLPRGPWAATLEVRSGLIVHEATATMTFGDTTPVEAQPADGTPAVLTAAALLAAALLIVVVVILVLRRRRNRSQA